MASFSSEGILSSIYELVRGNAVVTIIGSIAILLFASFSVLGRDKDGVPHLPETIPFLSNTIEVSTDPKSFWARALSTMQKLDTEILRFRLVGRPAFLVLGEKKTNVLFRTNSGFSADYYHNLLVHVMFGPSERDMARFKADVSGRSKVPLPGTEHFTEKDRIWAGWHHIFAENLLRTKPTNDLGFRFFDNFTAKIATLFKVGEWNEILVADWIWRHQTDSAARALNGSGAFDKNPGYFDLLKEFELSVIPIAFGPPKWMNPKPYRVREKYLAMNREYVEEALKDYDWDSPAASSPWEPVFGAPLVRGLVRWGLDIGLDTETIAGIFGIQVLNQNSNSVPASAWCIANTLTSRDPELLRNVRLEAQAALVVDEKTGKRTFDIQKLVTSPWLQAVYTETLRLRVGFSVTRAATRDTEIDGFRIANGSMVQAPIPIAHHDAVWETKDHPVREFWPHRHIKTVETTDESGKAITRTEFSLGNRSGYFFPYGGGATMCPGRHFAKQEIIGTLALFVTQFETEVVGWVNLDGSPSDREARNGVGMAVFQPDRDLKIRVKRRW